MAKYTLQPCTLRLDRILPVDAPPVVFTLEEMRKRFAPSAQPGALTSIAALRPTAFFGLVRDETGTPRTFIIFNPTRDNRISWLLRRDARFGDRLIELYRVERVERDARFSNEVSGERVERGERISP